jgi:hypothetical protein
MYMLDRLCKKKDIHSAVLMARRLTDWAVSTMDGGGQSLKGKVVELNRPHHSN